ncbi:MAG: sulfatase-like hydrolase/transferase [Lachnospiraceae bacterium]|jgi:arylsulfatase|nr:sulfatase-like hydrolase/transferase [Lachnospiraceae bacterium]
MNLISGKRPNVLLIYTDQQRIDSLSAYGDCPIKTRNIDMLASEGVKFGKCFVQNPVCGPSRMSFLTGRYCSGIGVGTNGMEFPRDTCIPVNRILRDYGYETAQIGKLHFQPHAKRDARDIYPNYGFDRFIVSDEPGCYDDAYTKWVEMNKPDELPGVRTSLPPAACRYHKPEYAAMPRNTHEPYVFSADSAFSHSAFVASETCRFLRERQPNKPFFAIAGFYAPHPPVNPPRQYIDQVDVNKIKLPVKSQIPEVMPELQDITDDEWRKIIQYYLALVLHVDDCIGEILNTLKEMNAWDNTLIIFTADHGEYLGDYGKIQKGMPGYDCITNVPMIFHFPEKIRPGRTVKCLIEAIDIVPTILDYCGVQSPPFIQGTSLFELLEGKTNHHKHEVLIENFVPYGLKETTVRTEQFMYYCNSAGQELLFDLQEDPRELHNVASRASYQNQLSDMRKRMIMKIQTAAYPNRETLAEY